MYICSYTVDEENEEEDAAEKGDEPEGVDKEDVEGRA